MTVADDTTVLHRGGPEALHLMREGAVRVLALGGLRTAEGRRELGCVSRELVSRRISPGGAADLLAAGIFLANLERDCRRAAPARFSAASAHWYCKLEYAAFPS
jgi:triphosphoribosyl-dephospho-CoA synthase